MQQLDISDSAMTVVGMSKSSNQRDSEGGNHSAEEISGPSDKSVNIYKKKTGKEMDEEWKGDKGVRWAVISPVMVLSAHIKITTWGTGMYL